MVSLAWACTGMGWAIDGARRPKEMDGHQLGSNSTLVLLPHPVVWPIKTTRSAKRPGSPLLPLAFFQTPKKDLDPTSGKPKRRTFSTSFGEVVLTWAFLMAMLHRRGGGGSHDPMASASFTEGMTLDR